MHETLSTMMAGRAFLSLTVYAFSKAPQQTMLDTKIYVDRIADMRVNDMNAVLEAVRQMALMKMAAKKMTCICGR